MKTSCQLSLNRDDDFGASSSSGGNNLLCCSFCTDGCKWQRIQQCEERVLYAVCFPLHDGIDMRTCAHETGGDGDNADTFPCQFCT